MYLLYTGKVGTQICINYIQKWNPPSTIMKLYAIDYTTPAHTSIKLTHGGPVTTNDDTDLGQHWLGWWFGDGLHQAIALAKVDPPSIWSNDI